jgi:SAM-dependent methyltransferase
MGALGVVRELTTIGWQFVLGSTPERKRRRYGDVEYDWEYRVDTTGATVGWRSRLLGLLHSPYQPIEPEVFREMVAELKIDFSQFTFIDIGSGKGRALLLAAKYPFKRILGVELLPELNQIARQNIRKFSSSRQRCRDIEAVCMDAAEFSFPLEPLVIFLFNPLPVEGLRKLLENLEGSLRANPREVRVVYGNPIFEEVFMANSLFAKTAGTRQYALFRAEL